MSSSPVVGRRMLAADLRRHRLASGRTIENVAEHLACSPAKVSRMETGVVKVATPDLRAVLDLYGVEESEREALFALVKQARARGWWQEFADVVPPGSCRFYGLEDGAEVIQQHVTSLVPGLLQTERYARALIGSVPGLDPAVIDRRIELRMRRQLLLGRAVPPGLEILLDEAVLCRMVGGGAVMAEQLRYLVEVAERPNVTLRVVEFDAAVHPAVGVAFTVFRFGADAVVFREQVDANGFLDEPDAVATYTSALASAADVAADPERSRALIAARSASFG